MELLTAPGITWYLIPSDSRFFTLHCLMFSVFTLLLSYSFLYYVTYKKHGMNQVVKFTMQKYQIGIKTKIFENFKKSDKFSV